MTSNSVSAQNFLALWSLNPGAASSCSADFKYMQFVRVFENITFCSLFTNRLRPFHNFNHHSNQHQPPLPLLIGDSLLLSCFVLVMIFASLSDSFKYFHTADVFAALVRASIWSCHVIVRYSLFGLFAYSAEHRKSFFFVAIFGRTISVAEHSVHPYCQAHVNIGRVVDSLFKQPNN